MTLSDRLEETQGRPSGFDYLRIGLAWAIVGYHTVVTSYGVDAQTALALGPARPITASVLPMFFALSGFLVSGSLERSRTLVSFLGLRVIRIFPALAVESLIAMMIIGPLFTVYSMNMYFSDPQFRSYAYNMLGMIHYDLPGVFLSNPMSKVNGQLWTLPYELKCYVAISVFVILRIYKRHHLFIFGCLALQVYVTLMIYLTIEPDDVGVVGGPVLVLAFLYGSLLYRIRNRIDWSFPLFVVALLASVVLLYFPVVNSLAALPMAYVTVYLGLFNPRRSSYVSGGDYSYGIFLYGFSIQQAVSAALPDMRHWWVNLIVAVPIIALVSYASWHLIEKRALALRKPLLTIEHWILPLHDHVSTMCSRAIEGGLQSRWGRRRLKSRSLELPGVPAASAAQGGEG